MFDSYTLSNGVKIVFEKIPFVRSVAFGIWVKNGSRNEIRQNNGISHFIEHMLFKGTSNRSALEIADEIDRIGGQINAYTSKEYTCYYTRTLDTHFDTALDILADMFFNSRFDDADIQKECNVIFEEINMYEDTPEELVHDILQHGVWKNDSLGYPILGTGNSIGSFDNGTFRDYYAKNYHTENTVIAIAGNFDESTVIKRIEAYFGSFKRDAAYVTNRFDTTYTPCVATKLKDIEQVHICIGFPGISMGSDESYTLAALNTIFGGGMSSRLFQTVREEHGLAYSIYSYNASYSDTGLFSIYAGLNPSQTEQAIKLIMHEINRLFTDKITEEQLDKSKEQLKSNYLLSLESSNSRMNSIGRAQLMLNRMQSPDEIIEKIDAVTLQRMYGLTEQIFNMKDVSLSAVGNIDGLDMEDILRASMQEV